MNKSVFCLFVCLIFVVLNIFLRFGILVKIVEIWMKCRLVFCVKSCVMVVFLISGGF